MQHLQNRIIYLKKVSRERYVSTAERVLPPWRKRMTLCIAAICHQARKQRIVFSTDWQVESETAGAEIQDKLYWIRDDWPALLAGTFTRAFQLKETYRTFVDRGGARLAVMFRSEFMEFFRQPLILYKHQLADEFIGSRLGIPYDVFLANRVWFPETTYTELLTAVRRIPLECQLLMPMFLEGDAYLWRINAEILEYCDNFAAIGSGMDIAEASLCQREQDEDTSLAKTLYHVYEAAQLASIAPGVGKQHTISVMYTPDGKNSLVIKSLSTKGEAVLKKKFKECGPKRVTTPEFDEGLLEVDFEVPKPSVSQTSKQAQ
jgi:hypothetical protein